jgi:hypothetical protein
MSFFLCWPVLYTDAPVVQTAREGRLYVYICEWGPYGLCIEAQEAHVYHCLYTHPSRVGRIH